MNEPVGPGRRTFCKALLYVASGASVASGCTDSPTNRAELTRFLVMQIAHPDAADGIGSSYIRKDIEINPLSVDQLTDVIIHQLGINTNDLSAISLQDVGERLADRVHQDFAEESVVAVDGWLLSKTEARLCALVYRHRHPGS